MARFKIISQVEKQCSNLSSFHIVMGSEIRQIGLIEYPRGTGWADGVQCNEEIVKALQKCYTKRVREL